VLLQLQYFLTAYTRNQRRDCTCARTAATEHILQTWQLTQSDPPEGQIWYPQVSRGHCDCLPQPVVPAYMPRHPHNNTCLEPGALHPAHGLVGLIVSWDRDRRERWGLNHQVCHLPSRTGPKIRDAQLPLFQAKSTPEHLASPPASLSRKNPFSNRAW
jgi:hypothetical protein